MTVCFRLYEEEQSFLEDGPFVSKLKGAFRPVTQRYQKLIDLATPHVNYRWYFAGFLLLVCAAAPTAAAT